MNNLELEHCLTTNKLTKKIFKGVYPANKLLDLRIGNGFYIANTSPESSKGLHWVGFSITPKCVEVFDSSGMLFLENKYFKKFIRKCKRKFIFNKKMIQNPNSNICGQYCLAFALYKAKGKDLCNFLKMFNESNLAQNDQIVLSIFYKNFTNPRCYQHSKNLYLCI